MKYSYNTASPDSYLLRNKQLGAKFNRQHIIRDYIVDFVCLEKGFIIEVDGGYHDKAEQREADANRSEEFAKMGFDVLRFNNNEVLQNIKNVLGRIEERILEK